MVAGQMLVGFQSGRALYLAHCQTVEHEEHQHCDHRDACSESDDVCLAALAHDHSSDPGHSHHCRCPHVHYRGDAQPVARFRPGNAFGRLSSPRFLRPSGNVGGITRPGEDATIATLLLADPGWPQRQLALRSVRLLI